MNAPAPVTDPRLIKACCADVWAHPGIRLLVGPALRPGGLQLTRSALSAVAIPTKARVLDIGCGPGATLGELRDRGLRAVGIDVSQRLALEARAAGATAVGDAERLPFPDGTFAAVVLECVLSAVPDKEAAVAEVARVLEAAGSVLMSDVVVEGSLPPPLDSFAGWIACAAGALSFTGYVDLVEAAGLRVERSESHDEELASLLAQVRRRLALVQGAARAGVVDTSPGGFPSDLVDLGQDMVARAVEAARAGTLGYALFVARRP
jgi:SAM-dependent methyltransferase